MDMCPTKKKKKKKNSKMFYESVEDQGCHVLSCCCKYKLKTSLPVEFLDPLL